MSLKIYIPTMEDFNYFMDYYGKNGIYKNKHLQDVKFSEFKKSCINYQNQYWQWCESNQKMDYYIDFDCGFDSIRRELIRDQMLFENGKDIIGFIFNPIDFQYGGIEHLEKNRNKN